MASSRAIRNKVEGNLNGKMVKYMMDNGEVVKNMAMEPGSQLMVTLTSGNGLTEKFMATVYIKQNQVPFSFIKVKTMRDLSMNT